MLSTPSALVAFGQTHSVVYPRSVRSIAVADSIVLAAENAGALVRSIDHGQTWGKSNVDTTLAVATVAACSDHRFIAGASTGLYESEDAGATWAALYETDFIFLDQLRCLESGDILIGGYRPDLIRFQRSDSSFNYVASSTGYETHWEIDTSLSSDVVWAGYRECLEFSCGGAAVSGDGGQTFQTVESWGEMWAVEAIASIDSGRVYVSAFQHSRRYDPGSDEWILLPDNFTAQRVIHLSGPMMYAASFNDVLRSADAGESWAEVVSLDHDYAYDVVATTDSSVLAATSVGIIRIEDVFATSIDRPSTSGEFSEIVLYPNPFQEHLWLETNGATLLSVDVYDLLGRRIRRVEPGGVSSRIELNMTGLPAGHYFVLVCDSTNCRSYQVTSLGI